MNVFLENVRIHFQDFVINEFKNLEDVFNSIYRNLM